MATDGHTEDINKFLSSLGHCFEDADKALKDECNSVPLDYTESWLEDHLQIVNAIAIAIQYYGGDELKQLVSNLQTFSQTLLYKIYTTKVQRDVSGMWVCVGYVSGGLRAHGIFVQRHQIREILTTIDPVGRALHRRAAIRSRQYNVRAPNHMWHIVGNQKLVNWRFVVYDCTDGYSRAIVYIKCALNNLASTVLRYFIEGTPLDCLCVWGVTMESKMLRLQGLWLRGEVSIEVVL